MPAPVASVAARGVAPVRAPPRRARVRSRVVAALSSAPSSDGRAPRPTRDDGDVRCPSAPRRAALALASAAALAASAPAPPALAGQPIEWVFSGGSGQSIGDIWKDSLEESGIEVKREPKTPPPAAPDDDGSASSSSVVAADASLAAPSPESEPVVNLRRLVADGFVRVYDKSGIRQWVEQRAGRGGMANDPMSREPLCSLREFDNVFFSLADLTWMAQGQVHVVSDRIPPTRVVQRKSAVIAARAVRARGPRGSEGLAAGT